MDEGHEAAVPAGEKHHPQSTLFWLLDSLGSDAVWIGIAAVAVFVGAWITVRRSRRPELIASFAIFLPTPFLIGVWRALSDAVGGFYIVSPASPDLPITVTDLTRGLAEACIAPLVGLVVSIPSFAVILVGWWNRFLSLPAGSSDESRIESRAKNP